MYLYAIMKTMFPPGYHHIHFMATHALGHMMYGYTLLVPMYLYIKLCHKLSMTHAVFKSHKRKTTIIYMLS